MSAFRSLPANDHRPCNGLMGLQGGRNATAPETGYPEAAAIRLLPPPAFQGTAGPCNDAAGTSPPTSPPAPFAGTEAIRQAKGRNTSSTLAADHTGSFFYAGTVVHHRTRPKVHTLRYAIFNLLLDLDDLPALARRSRLFAHNARGLFSFHDADHGEGKGPLRPWVEAQLAAAGIAGGGPIRLLCMPRILGHAFNPLSVYFCHRADGTLTAILYQVNNTFGQRHSYLLPVEGEARPIRQHCDKGFYVSPFMPMALRYRFTVTPPGEGVAVAVDALDEQGPLILTRFAGRRRPLTDATLLRAFLRMPLLGLKVVAGIHWEALKLWRKGLRPHPRPPAPAEPVTFHATGPRS